MCLNAFRPAWLLPEAEAERQRRAGGQREGGRRAVTQAEGSQQTSFPQGTRHSGTNPPPPCSPTPQWQCIDGLHMTTEARLIQCTGPHPRHHPWPPESALSHSFIISALLRCRGLFFFVFVYVFRCPRCHHSMDLGVLVLFLAVCKEEWSELWSICSNDSRQLLPLWHIIANYFYLFSFVFIWLMEKFEVKGKTSGVTRHPATTTNL